MTFCELFAAIKSHDSRRRQLADAQIRALTHDIAACWIEYLTRRNGQ
jgi:hypothetical protein